MLDLKFIGPYLGGDTSVPLISSLGNTLHPTLVSLVCCFKNPRLGALESPWLNKLVSQLFWPPQLHELLPSLSKGTGDDSARSAHLAGSSHTSLLGRGPRAVVLGSVSSLFLDFAEFNATGGLSHFGLFAASLSNYSSVSCRPRLLSSPSAPELLASDPPSRFVACQLLCCLVWFSFE